MSYQQNPEQWAAERLAMVLDSAASVLADAAEEYRRMAKRARAGINGNVGYAHLANRAHMIAVSALPNLGLPQAFEMAATADRYRDEPEAAQP